MKLTNACSCESAFIRQKERAWERGRDPTVAKAGSLDVIEDDISDYRKDRNLSLFVLYFQLFYHSQSLWLLNHLENILNCLRVVLECHLFIGDPSFRMKVQQKHHRHFPHVHTWATSLHPFMIAKRQTSRVQEANADCRRSTFHRVSQRKSDHHQNPCVIVCSRDIAVCHVSPWRCAL